MLAAAAARSARADEVPYTVTDPNESPYQVVKPQAPPPPPPELRWEIAVGSSILSAPIRGGTTPFGAGLGGHLGVGIPNLYIGARAHYFFGGSDIDVTNTSIVYGAELGYGIQLGAFRNVAFKLRPMVGVGGLRIFHKDPSSIANLKPDVVTTASSQSSASRRSDVTTVDNVYVEPSVQLLLQSGKLFLSLGPTTMIIPGISYDGGSMTWVTYGASGCFGARL